MKTNLNCFYPATGNNLSKWLSMTQKFFSGLFLLILFASLTGGKAMAAIVYVKSSAMGLNNGKSWENAFTSLQDGIDNCAAGDNVYVWRGVYKPTKKFGGTEARNAAFQMKDQVNVFGGFGPGSLSVETRTDFGFGEINETILSGDIGVAGDPSDNCYHVFYNADAGNISSPTKLDGFTIRDGNANSVSTTYPHQFMGGGVYNGPQSFVSFVNCKFYNNSAGLGGAFYANGLGGSFQYCIFNNNNAIVVNSTGGFGGAIYTFLVIQADFTNCLIYENTAVTSGGGIAIYSSTSAKRSTTSIIHTTIAYNHANLAGGIRIWDYCDAHVDLSIIQFNTHSGTEGKNIHVSSNSTFKILGSVHNRAQADFTGGTGTSVMIYLYAGSDPAFLNPAAGNFRIGGNSDATDYEEVNLYNEGTTKTDLSGHKRVQGIGPDCGCYEYTPGLDPSNNKSAAFTTDPIVLTTGSKVTVNSAITYLGATATQYGHTWNKESIFNTSLAKTQLGTRSTLGSFSSEISGLIPGYPYYVAPYATTSAGTYYGLPQVVTIPRITSTPALINTSICTGLTNLSYEVNVRADLLLSGIVLTAPPGLLLCQRGDTGSAKSISIDMIKTINSNYVNPTIYLKIENPDYHSDISGDLVITTIGAELKIPINIKVNEAPKVYSFTGAGAYCPGGDGVEVGFSGSEIGVDYCFVISDNYLLMFRT
jgi:hypothetical protein